MTEEDKVSTPVQHPWQEAEQSGKTTAAISGKQRRAVLLRWIAIIGAVADIFIIVLYVALYLQTETWQTLGVAGLAVLALAFMVLASWLVHRRKLDVAGYVLLSAVAVSYGGGELVLAGGTLYLTVGGILLIFLVGSMVLPRQWGIWLVVSGLFGASIWLINQFEPLPRYDITQLPLLNITFPGLTGLVALAILWQTVRAFRIGTIYTRLLIAFVLTVLLPAAAISVGSAVLGWQSGQQQVIGQLQSVATLKEAEIETLVNSLRTDLIAVLPGKDATLHARVLLQESPVPSEYLSYQMRSRFQQAVEQVGRFEELFLMDLQGRVILSTDATQEGKIYSNQTYFQEGLKGSYLQPPFFSSSLGQMSVVAARPIVDEQGHVWGVLAGRASLAVLDAIMRERAGLGNTGETYLVGANHALLTTPRFGQERIYVRTQAANAAIETQVNGFGLYDNYRGVPVVGIYHWLPELQAALLAEQNQSEAFAAIYKTMGVNAGVALISLLLAVIASILITRSIATPLTDLAETAAQIAAGDLERVARVKREDEIGALAQAFNSMTTQLRGLIGSLEQRVADRTRELEQRSAYLEASAEVGRAATSILETDQLIRQAVELIRERFGLYYVGLFLVDETGEWAVLRAGTGEAGRAMLARGHRIRIGEGMIGWSIANAQARVALEASEDAARLATVELPDTRSEAALPLRSRGQVLGALTVQSDQLGAFDSDTLVVLQTMADQVAVALDNAHLFAESQAALEAERRAYGELSRGAWAELLRAQPNLGFLSDERGIFPASGPWEAQMEAALQRGETTLADGDGTTLAIPIRVRDQVVGVIDAHKPSGAGKWTEEEIGLMETLIEQLGIALESARLYQDTQRRAVREQLTGEVTARMRETLDMETVLKTAVREISKALELAALDVRLGTEAESAMPTAKGQADSGANS